MYTNLHLAYENSRMHQQTRRDEAEAYRLGQLARQEHRKTAHYLTILAALQHILMREAQVNDDSVLVGTVQQPTAS